MPQEKKQVLEDFIRHEMKKTGKKAAAKKTAKVK